jgi:hypothetical protein
LCSAEKGFGSRQAPKHVTHAERRFAMHVPTTAAGIPDGRAHSREIGSSAGEMGMGMGMAALSRQARAKTGASVTRGVLVWLDTS